MHITNNINNNSSTFGMAIYSPSKEQIVQKIGNDAAEQFEHALPKLKQLAQDVDISIIAKHSLNGDEGLNHLKIYIDDITPFSKNSIIRFFQIIKYNFSNPIHSEENIYLENITHKSIIRITKNLKENFLKKRAIQ